MPIDIDFRHGDWRDVLTDVECDLLVADTPYGKRTHRGHDAGVGRANKAGMLGKFQIARRRQLSYNYWTPEDVHEFVERWDDRVHGWFTAFSCSDLGPHWRAALAATGRTAFAPIPIVMRGMSVRMSGDGPANWAVYLNVARPKSLHRWGALPGSYDGSPVDAGQNPFDRSKNAVAGAKPLWLMRKVIGDYSRRGDVVCDPTAGGGTSLVAAASMLRVPVGCERDLETYELARARLSGDIQVELDAYQEPTPHEQMELAL